MRKPRRLKIALLMELAPRKRGSFEAWMLELCRQAAERGHFVTVFGMQPIHPDIAQELAATGAEWRDYDALAALPLWRETRLLAGYDVIHLNMLAPRSKVAIASYLAWPAKVLFMDRTGGLPAGGSLRRSSLTRAVTCLLDRITFARAEGVAGVTHFVRERARNRFYLDGTRTRTIANGIDLERFRPRETAPARPRITAASDETSAPRGEAERRALEVITLAYLIPEKGLDHLLRALPLVEAPLKLTIVGDGPEGPRLKALAAALGCADRVRFVGLSNDVPALLREADLYVHPSLAEAFGNAVAEAMASGLPVVATRVGGLPEVVADNETGLLVEPRDSRALAWAIARLATDPALRARFGAAGRRRAEERFDVRRCGREHVEWCESAIASAGPAPRPAARVVKLPTGFRISRGDGFRPLPGGARPAAEGSGRALLPSPEAKARPTADGSGDEAKARSQPPRWRTVVSEEGMSRTSCH